MRTRTKGQENMHSCTLDIPFSLGRGAGGGGVGEEHRTFGTMDLAVQRVAVAPVATL